jgi:hypothetical protein
MFIIVFMIIKLDVDLKFIMMIIYNPTLFVLKLIVVTINLPLVLTIQIISKWIQDQIILQDQLVKQVLSLIWIIIR